MNGGAKIRCVANYTTREGLGVTHLGVLLPCCSAPLYAEGSTCQAHSVGTTLFATGEPPSMTHSDAAGVFRASACGVGAIALGVLALGALSMVAIPAGVLAMEGGVSERRGAEMGPVVEESTADGVRWTRTQVRIPSSLDGSLQPSYLLVPKESAAGREGRPLLVSLHSWSGDVEQRNVPLEQLAARRGWLTWVPHFRGSNNHPEACGSRIAQQDILDGVDWVLKNHDVDTSRIYLTGSSGGGHMTLLMAGRYPDRWSAASAWVPITDLSAWHQRHAAGTYGEMMRLCCGGPPGESWQVDREYRERSPMTHLAGTKGLPVDIAAGIRDGHDGSVPIDHSLYAFNVLAAVWRVDGISQLEIDQLLRPAGKLEEPRESDLVEDESFGRAIYLRRYAGPSRVTIFEGGHEGLAEAAVAWLEGHQRPTFHP
jgi:pimeloyl-ACP methyl ester carboxylesterase